MIIASLEYNTQIHDLYSLPVYVHTFAALPVIIKSSDENAHKQSHQSIL